jgi:hemerythrin-like domain-containing protein
MHTCDLPGKGIDRRPFVAAVGTAGAGLCVPAFAADHGGGGGGARRKEKDTEEEEVSPAEDLMREHGVLKRVLLVYEEGVRRIDAKQDLPPDTLKNAAGIVRAFIEDYHEKLEEDYLFPRFEKATQLTDLTTVLRAQHQAGRRITDRIMQLATMQTLKEPQSAASLRELLHQFGRMYAPHEAREDTVLFPAFRKLVSNEEYGALGEDFEKKEHELFGEGGFDEMVDRVAAIEKKLGIYDLSQFTAKV